MYVGLAFSVPGVTFDLDSLTFEVLACGSSAKHSAVPKKESAKINPIVCVFMTQSNPDLHFPSTLQLRCRQDTASFQWFAVRWIAAKSLRLPQLLMRKFLTATAFSRVALAVCGGVRCARTTATTFDIFYRLQVTNFGLLKSAPNGLNHMDIRRLFLHGRCRLPDPLLLANISSPCQSKKGTFSAIGIGSGRGSTFLLECCRKGALHVEHRVGFP